jgi:hypothetical protein
LLSAEALALGGAIVTTPAKRGQQQCRRDFYAVCC